jgi:hypothetical protein
MYDVGRGRWRKGAWKEKGFERGEKGKEGRGGIACCYILRSTAWTEKRQRVKGAMPTPPPPYQTWCQDKGERERG